LKGIQEDLFTQQFYNIDEKLKPYAFKILDTLYVNTEKGFNIKELHNKLENKNIVFIRKALTQLDKINLIQILKSKCKKTEKRYFITKSGKLLITNHYSGFSK